jgi:isopropylmalate/homocitrate/citramalate synthase
MDLPHKLRLFEMLVKVGFKEIEVVLGLDADGAVALASGAQTQAAAYLDLRINQARTAVGVGLDANIVSASLKAIVSGLNRVARQACVPQPAGALA